MKQFKTPLPIAWHPRQPPRNLRRKCHHRPHLRAAIAFLLNRININLPILAVSSCLPATLQLEIQRTVSWKLRFRRRRRRRLSSRTWRPRALVCTVLIVAHWSSDEHSQSYSLVSFPDQFSFFAQRLVRTHRDAECTRIVIPVFQRAYCWSQATTVPAWWRDTANGSRHSCGKIVLKQHNDGSYWCLDGQQRLTTTLLLVAAARDTLLQFESAADESVAICQSILYTDVDAAQASGASLTIGEGEHVAFCRLTPSFVDRKPFLEIICEGLGAHVTPSTRTSVQWHTKCYFAGQFSALIRGLTPKQAVAAVHDRLVSALSMQVMLIAPQAASDSSVSQIYQVRAGQVSLHFGRTHLGAAGRSGCKNRHCCQWDHCSSIQRQD
jgi:hypothetical protein